MKIAIAGGTGLLGSKVSELARAEGHDVTVLHIPRPAKSEAHDLQAWKDALSQWTPETFSGYDAVMFFGGEPINSKWTEKKRQRIELSRQVPCRKMADCCTRADRPPAVIVSASATGFYGDRGDEVLTEEAKVGRGFLAPTTATWEACWESARRSGIRVALLRFGVVLSPHGGALKMMLPPFKLGLGGPMGGGRQWMPWISLQDAARLAVFALQKADLHGPINAVSPGEVRNGEFARILGHALKRPAVIPIPGKVLRLAMGLMARETILASCRARPAKALDAGFTFADNELDGALKSMV